MSNKLILLLSLFFLASCSKSDNKKNDDPNVLNVDSVVSEVYVDEELYNKFHYDDLNRMSKAEIYFDGEIGIEFDYSYNNKNQLTRLIRNEDYILEFHYDDEDKLTLIKEIQSDVHTNDYIVAYEGNYITITQEGDGNIYSTYTFIVEEDNLIKQTFVGFGLEWEKTYSDFDDKVGLPQFITDIESIFASNKNNPGKSVYTNSMTPNNPKTTVYEYTYNDINLVKTIVATTNDTNIENWKIIYHKAK